MGAITSSCFPPASARAQNVVNETTALVTNPGEKLYWHVDDFRSRDSKCREESYVDAASLIPHNAAKYSSALTILTNSAPNAERRSERLEVPEA